jgi:hypothetical protein
MVPLIKHYLPFAIFLAVVGVVMYRRLRSMHRGRKVTPERLWIRPAIVAVVLTLVAVTSPLPGPAGLAVCLGAAAVGLASGYFLALHQHFSRDPETGHVIARTSPVGMILFFGLFAARFVIRMVFFNPGAGTPPAGGPLVAHGGNILLFTDAMLTFVFALVVAQTWEMWRRINKLEKPGAVLEDPAPGE